MTHKGSKSRGPQNQQVLQERVAALGLSNLIHVKTKGKEELELQDKTVNYRDIFPGEHPHLR